MRQNRKQCLGQLVHKRDGLDQIMLSRQLGRLFSAVPYHRLNIEERCDV